MKNACPKKIVLMTGVGFGVFYEAGFHHAQYSASQELFIILTAIWSGKCYNVGIFPEILRQLKRM
jgi:hypothetical protein